MATATILMIYCVRQATGTDSPVNDLIFNGIKNLPDIIPGAGVFQQLPDLAGIIQAIDIARSDPDNLYITTTTNAGRENAIWPEPGVEVEMQAMQNQTPNVAVTFDYALNISLWDYDTVSDDDLLGSVTIFETEQGQGEISRKAWSEVENSCYYVVYRVD